MDKAEEILQGLRAGDAHAWEQFHAHFWKLVLAVVSRKFPDLAATDLARDVTTDTLLAVVQQVQAGAEINPAALRGYVMQVATRKGLQVVLERRVHRAEINPRQEGGLSWDLGYEDANFMGSMDRQPDTRPDPEQALRIARKSQLMRSALGKLKSSERDILQRFYFDGETKEQIMAAHALTHDQFRLRKTRALTKLMAQVYGQASIANAETGTSYTRRELQALVGPCQH